MEGACLLEGVDLEELEAVDVEQPDVPFRQLLLLRRPVHAAHDEAEEARVYNLDDGVAREQRLLVVSSDM